MAPARRGRRAAAPGGPGSLIEDLSESATIAQEQTHRINREISVPEVRLIGVEGEPLGLVGIEESVIEIEENGFDVFVFHKVRYPPM